MADKKENYKWAMQQWPEDCEIISCKEVDPYKDFKMDPSGFYVLVRIEWDYLKIAVAICNKEHKVIKVFRGNRSRDIYEAIFQYEKKHRQTWFQDKTHIAYLGKELKKAELAMSIGIKEYFQE